MAVSSIAPKFHIVLSIVGSISGTIMQVTELTKFSFFQILIILLFIIILILFLNNFKKVCLTLFNLQYLF